MSTLRKAARLLLPPILMHALRRPTPPNSDFAGRYATWTEACEAAEGYQAEAILSAQLAAARKVRDGLAAYERDSVIFDEIEHSFPALAALLYVASRNGNAITVLDFGGALGSSYFESRGMLKHIDLRWCVVEQPHFVAVGKAEFESRQLAFFGTIDQCFERAAPDLILLSSVLQYLEEPLALLERVAARGVRFILIDRTPILDRGPERIVVQTVPPRIYSASYPCRLFAPGSIEATLSDRYETRYRFEAHIGTRIEVGDAVARYHGLFLERREGAGA